jgi:hypothetical protein
MRRSRKAADRLGQPLSPGAEQQDPESPSHMIDFAKIVRDFRARSVSGGYLRAERRASARTGPDAAKPPPEPA